MFLGPIVNIIFFYEERTLKFTYCQSYGKHVTSKFSTAHVCFATTKSVRYTTSGDQTGTIGMYPSS